MGVALACSGDAMAQEAPPPNADPAAITLPQISVQDSAWRPWQPVQGYVAPATNTGTKTDTPIIEAPQSVGVVTRDQVDDQGAGGVSQALRYTPGVLPEVRPSARYDSVFVRGFGGQGTGAAFVNFLDGLRQGRGGGFGVPNSDPWLLERIEVLRVSDVTPAMRRVTLGGAEFEGLRGGPNLKLLLPPRPGMTLALPANGPDGKPVWAPDAERAVVRTYTVSRLDEAARELDIDFVLHGDEGVASAWANAVTPGDAAGVAGLGGRTVRPAARYVLAGDHTAVPALANILAVLPRDATGDAVIEIPGAEEERLLAPPPGLRVTWLHHGPHGAGRTRLLGQAVTALTITPGEDVFAWVGAESAAARAIRTHLRDGIGLDRRRLLVIGYWKLGMSETDYGKRLDHDRDADYHAADREDAAAQPGNDGRT